jgi:S-methylmethionine-dependent homocysteine/selenocysteine methylase|tara:strand:+ start:490 stop:1398 length:909 start_codon:yes stop_codon:yes gene_type:complete
VSKIILGDGGMGTELRFRGVEVPSHVDDIWSALAITEAPEIIKKIHLDYIEAGSNYITINNYAVTQPILSRNNIADQLEDLTLKAVEIAKEAIKESGMKTLLAGSLPPLETSYRPDLILPESEMIDYYSELSIILENEVDIIICETMSSSLEAKCALSSIQESKADIWISWTLHGNRRNTLPSGENLKSAFLDLQDLKADAFLVNCCGANLVAEGINILSGLTKKPVGGYANAENIIAFSENYNINNQAEDDQRGSRLEINKLGYANEAEKWIDLGATIIGGCCRTRPSYIRELNNLINKRS